MSDQDDPPPMDENSPEPEAPESSQPAADSESESPSLEASEAPAPEPEESAPAESTSAPAPAFGAVGLGQGKLAENDEKTMGMLAHILGGITCILGPLLIWLIKKDESPFVDDQGKEALNFQITVLIGYVASGVIAVLPVIGCISAILYPVIGIASLIMAILGGLESNKGKAYRYPFALRLIS